MSSAHWTYTTVLYERICTVYVTPPCHSLASLKHPRAKSPFICSCNWLKPARKWVEIIRKSKVQRHVCENNYQRAIKSTYMNLESYIQRYNSKFVAQSNQQSNQLTNQMIVHNHIANDRSTIQYAFV